MDIIRVNEQMEKKVQTNINPFEKSKLKIILKTPYLIIIWQFHVLIDRKMMSALRKCFEGNQPLRSAKQ